MSPYARLLRFLVLSNFRTGAPVGDRPEPASEHPRAAARSRSVTIAVAVVVPILAGVVLVPSRDAVGQSSAILFVLPTLFVALARGPLGAVVAGVVSSLAYNALHTQPYYSLVIEDSDEIVAMVVLLVAGTVVGVTSSHLREMSEAAFTRGRDVDGFVALVGGGRTPSDLADIACRELTTILRASSATWHPGYHGTVDPVMSTAGTVSNRSEEVLPSSVEIPATVGLVELGRFVVRSEG
ncbi:MAG: DUF4118 domain-containing protein, partial [Ilumatobacter sp.]